MVRPIASREHLGIDGCLSFDECWCFLKVEVPDLPNSFLSHFLSYKPPIVTHSFGRLINMFLDASCLAKRTSPKEFPVDRRQSKFANRASADLTPLDQEAWSRSLWVRLASQTSHCSNSYEFVGGFNFTVPGFRTDLVNTWPWSSFVHRKGCWWLWQKFPLFCIVVELTTCFEAKCVDKMEVGTRSQFSSSSFTVSPVLFSLQEMDLFPFKKAIWDRQKSMPFTVTLHRFSPSATLGTKVYQVISGYQILFSSAMLDSSRPCFLKGNGVLCDPTPSWSCMIVPLCMG